jgi:hypothetical protein
MSRLFSLIEAGFVPGDLRAFKKEGGKIRLYKDSPSEAPTQMTQTSLTYGPEFQPFAGELMRRAGSLASQQYTPYEYNRIAGFDPMQLQAQQAAANMRVSPYIGQSAGLAQMAAQYQPGGFQNPYIQQMAGMSYGPGTFRPERVSSQFAPSQFQAAQVSPQFAPTQFQAERVGTSYTPGEFTPERVSGTYDPTRFRAQDVKAQQVSSGQSTTGRFTDPNVVQSYMSPYMQNVVEIQKREAQRQADIAAAQRGAAAVRAGAFGGSRQAIENAEAQRNLATQMGDIQAKGSQAAFEQAAQQFQTDEARNLAMQQENVRVKLQAALANQQTGLAAALANQSKNLEAQQMAEQSKQFGASRGMQAALANQQAAMQAQQAREQSRQFGAETGLRGSLANQQAMMEAQRAAEQSKQFGTETGLRGALANQQALLEAGRLVEQSRQFGSEADLRAALANQAKMLEASQLGEQSRQFGAEYGMRGLQSALQAQQEAQRMREQSRQFGADVGLRGAAQLGQLGQQQFGQARDIIGMQSTAGAERQAMLQRKLQQDYEDFLAQRKFPYQQLQFAQEMLRGMPMQSTESIYRAPPSPYAQAAGLAAMYMGGQRGGYFANGGLAGLGLYNMTR